ncbi:MAG: alpha-1,2-fucosyltransferase [Sphingobacterium composti]|uniref:alpha-1,2-fucosyltransferase n=1 Tax=Sphingobacterium composti TaxID=363260 RepID=UPI00135C8323|nr:alpha-1,2-fucosyltransferase [Sphingobacterium composti Ten et al. 2007 non Yoo et al. 2007]
MKIVKIHAGLGNQMFQYALVQALQKFGHKVKIDFSEFEVYNIHNGYELGRAFNIHMTHITKMEQKLFYGRRQRIGYRLLRFLLNTNNAFYIEKPEFSFSEDTLKNQKHAYLSGYWQHHSYVDLVEDELRTNFIFSPTTGQRNQELEAILQNTPNTVSIHVRRGDYLQHPTLNGICDKAFYERAIAHINSHIEGPIYVFFSNDIPWCKENFNFPNAIFVDWNTGENSFRDMQMMSLCHHHIISNSSFSWWAAWLNTKSDKMVIAPTSWIKDEQADPKALLLPEFVKL